MAMSSKCWFSRSSSLIGWYFRNFGKLAEKRLNGALINWPKGSYDIIAYLRKAQQINGFVTRLSWNTSVIKSDDHKSLARDKILLRVVCQFSQIFSSRTSSKWYSLVRKKDIGPSAQTACLLYLRRIDFSNIIVDRLSYSLSDWCFW